MTPPTVTHVDIRVPPSLLAWALTAATDFLDEEDGEQLVTGTGSLCAARGPVGRHTDDDVPPGKWVFGLVLRSDGHRLHTDAVPDGLMLNAGDLYCLDPAVPHWTTCPDAEDALVFTVEMLDPASGTPREIALDMVLDLAMARVRDLEAKKSEGARYRGIHPITGEGG